MTTAAARRLALVLEYHGEPFHGSQRQERHSSIQRELEEALFRLTREHARVAFAGRTDAGVHAVGQVAAFTTNARHTPSTFVQGLNSLLPKSIAVRNAQMVDLSFDPRRDAESREYRYLIYNAPQRSPLWMDRSWHVPRPLDTVQMQEALRALVGEHDFAAFSRREPTTTVRRVMRTSIDRRGPIAWLDFKANAFLRHQVRRMVGAVVQVGLGKQAPTFVRDKLLSAEPSSAGPVAPACGLVLTEVSYSGLDLTGGARYDFLVGLDGSS